MARHSSKARRRPKARPQGILELNAQGFGFVKTAEGEFFVSASKTNGAFPGDLVEVAPMGSSRHDSYSPRSRKPAARVLRVIMRARETLIGRYEVAEPFGVVIPEDPSVPCDIFTLRADAPHVKDGDIVEVRIIEFPSRNSAATGTVVRVVGSEGDSGIDIDLIVAEHQFETRFSDSALKQAEECTLDVATLLARSYRDLRSDLIFTIDPVDARDFDDAVSLERQGNDFVLGVHIADVSQFVGFDSSLDLDARRRATSVYLVDRVIPMLPERLSNGLCSLVPGQDRAAVSVRAVVSPEGAVRSFEVFPSVIRSKARLSYEQAQCLLSAAEGEGCKGGAADKADTPSSVGATGAGGAANNNGVPSTAGVLGNAGASDSAEPAGVGAATTPLESIAACDVPQGSLPLDADMAAAVQERVVLLNRLAIALHARRKKDGCMDFDRVEAKAVLDADGRPVGITYRTRTDATALIEEAMILANALVAQWLEGQGLPCVYRVHDEPDGDALRSLYQVLQEWPLFNEVDKRLFCAGNPAELQKALSLVQGFPQKELVNTLLLRSMKRAVYRTAQSPHYGLALESYCHFTSPIRRYPDLLVHRMCKEAFFGHSATYEAQKNSMPWMAEHSSHMEREAEKAARQSQLTKIIEYLQQFIGSTYSGIVSHVSNFGLMVRLECTAAGSLPVEELGEEYFAFDPERQMLVGSSTGTRYRLGQRLDVVLVAAHPRERRLAFKLAGTQR